MNEHNIYCPKCGEDLGECVLSTFSDCLFAGYHADTTSCSECLGEDETNGNPPP